MKGMLLILVLAVGLAGCSQTAKTPAPASGTQTASASPDPAHNSRNALDWAGTYHGVLPCADCPGVDTLLTINSDLTYQLQRRYIDRDNQWSRDTGEFFWRDDGAAIELKGLTDAPVMYQVGENQLFALAPSGERVNSEMASRYRLTKQGPDPVTAGVKWILVELRGQTVSVEGKKPFFRIDDQSGKVTGIAGCNRFFGQFNQTPAGRVGFSELGSTMMACPNMATEQAFLEVLSQADTMSRKGNQLSLTKARMAPLARFEAAVPIHQG